MIRSIEWLGDRVRYIDQTALPLREEYVECYDVNELAAAIRSLRIRGAPLIGVAAAYGIAAAAIRYEGKDPETFLQYISRAAQLLLATRPTAVNLRWALERMQRTVAGGKSISEMKEILRREAIAIHEEDAEMCRQIGAHGASLIPQSAAVLTHCNAGALATGGEGTALSVITTASAMGKTVRVFADETRPLLQGARLTAWELMKAGIEVTLITDSTAASLMAKGAVDLVVTGADRIAANGDAANKIGTYPLALAARHHDIPMYIAAPSSTVDPGIASGAEIPIEERKAEELTEFHGERHAPVGVRAYTPAFDVTPAALISAIITETGVHRPPYHFSR